MKQQFYKYHGTGNDFVIIDNRQLLFDKSDAKHIRFLCDRRFGIGADGLILLENHESYDFKMVYFNADGNESTMCGNGGRCIVAFAQYLNIIVDDTEFMAIDGMHRAIIQEGNVSLQMVDVLKIEKHEQHTFLNTGSPHHVEIVSDLENLNIKEVGAKIRYGAPYNADGSNVNFVVKNNDDTFTVRTYERGVEDETLSCGTGVTAVALAMHAIGQTSKNKLNLHVQGGQLQVSFEQNGNGYHNIWLSGPAVQVFKGDI